jgi:hypothetical protein
MPRQLAAWIRLVLVCLFATALAPVTVLAEAGRIRFSTELEYRGSDADITNKQTGVETKSDFSFFQQVYDLEIQKEIFPYLEFRSGGVLRLTDSKSTRRTLAEGTQKADLDERLGRLFGEFNLDNPLYRGSGAYHWTEFKVSDFDTTKITREEWIGRWNWRPDGFPWLDLQYNNFSAHDDARTRDSRNERFLLESRYHYEGLSSDYTYTRNEQEERITDSGALSQTHNGGALYSTSFFGDRVSATGGFRLEHTTVEPTGAGDFRLPTSSPGTPFYSLDDSDPQGLPECTQGCDLTDVNIGGGGPLVPVSVGLTFASPTEVDTVYVLPEEEPGNASAAQIASVADSFLWRVYTSDDQVNWTEQPGVTVAPYSVIDNRFEISFSPPEGELYQYVKVRTMPLSNAPWPIPIAELQAFTTIVAAEIGGSKLKEFVQHYRLGAQWAITDRTTTGYDGFYRRQKNEPFDQLKTTLTNSINLQHVFGPVFVADARVLREDGHRTGRGDVVSHQYGGSLRANYFNTLDQTLVYSGRHEKNRDGSGTRNTILLRTNADLYRDWSINLDLGYSWRDPILDEKSTEVLLRLSTAVAPHPRVHFTIDYDASWKKEKGEPTWLDQNATFQAFWVPLRTLSLFAVVNLRHKESANEDLMVDQSYSINWAPFPDGTLNFLLSFNQILDTRDNEARLISPEVTWQINRATLVTVRFNFGTLESQTEKSDVRNIRAEFKIFY